MSPSILSMGVAGLAAVGLVITLGAVSLLIGALHFLFARPRLTVLKTQNGDNGFAFGFSWDSSREPAKFNTVTIRLFNPFGSPTQVDMSRSFDTMTSSFAVDLDLGEAMKNVVKASGLDNASIMIQLNSQDGLSHQFTMKANKVLDQRLNARQSAAEFNENHKIEKPKQYYNTVQRTFISEPLPASNKALKIATNPEFAGDFASAGGASEAPKENFAVSKVWIEPGCIVCNACEGIFPEVFEVTSDSCLIRPGAPLDDGLRILEASDACPVEVIKFDKVV